MSVVFPVVNKDGYSNSPKFTKTLNQNNITFFRTRTLKSYNSKYHKYIIDNQGNVKPFRERKEFTARVVFQVVNKDGFSNSPNSTKTVNQNNITSFCRKTLKSYNSKYQKYVIHNQGNIKPFVERLRPFRVTQCID